MAKRNNQDSGGFVFKTGLFAILAGLAWMFFNKKSNPDNGSQRPDRDPQAQHAPAPAATPAEDRDYLPVSTTGAVVNHTYYSLSYSEDHEQAEWIAYELFKKRLNDSWVDRESAFFRPDPAVRTESATPRDYSGSGYDRGHLCPAADMAFDTLAMSETFLMSNMSPQVRNFNGGIWRELEELTRDWARRFGRLYVVAGPVLKLKGQGSIGFSKVTVPTAYYKVLYAPDQNRAIAFVMPNAVSDRPVMEYAFDINYVENMTGLDFFPKLLNGLGEELEGSLDKNAWPINERRYKERLDKWNRR